MNIALLMAWSLIACAVLIVIQQGYLLLQWNRTLNDERYILQLEYELQYYRSLDTPLPSPLLECIYDSEDYPNDSQR